MPVQPSEVTYGSNPEYASAAKQLGVPEPNFAIHPDLSRAYRYLVLQQTGIPLQSDASPMTMLSTLHSAPPALLRQALLSSLIEGYNSGDITSMWQGSGDAQARIASGGAIQMQMAFPQLGQEDPDSLLRALLGHLQAASPSQKNQALLEHMPALLRGSRDIPPPMGAM